MAKPKKNLRFAAKYSTWIIYNRNGVWWADGRSADAKLGRHSLGTRDREAARTAVAALDLKLAIERGVAVPQDTKSSELMPISLDEGLELYNGHLSRSPLLDGARETSRIRYRSVFKKFLTFAAGKGIRDWNSVTAEVLQSYLSHLEKLDFAYRTISLEITTLKQINKFLVTSKKLPPESKIVLPLTKAQGTTTYCWREEEVKAILGICAAAPAKRWLHDILFTLAHTGLRIGELIDLRWANLDLDTGMITIRDESTSGRKKLSRARQTTKGGRNRVIPIHDNLKPILVDIPREAVDGYVFHGPLGGRVKAFTVRTALIRDALVPLAQRFPTSTEELGFADGRLHSFRHFYCSWCARKRMAPNVVMRLMGHRDSKMVDHYFHLHADDAREEVRRLTWTGSGIET